MSNTYSIPEINPCLKSYERIITQLIPNISYVQMISTSKKLRVLGWKCILLRQKNWILSIFELLSPVIVTLAVYGFSTINRKETYQINNPKNILKLNSAKVRLKYMAYSPGNKFTDLIMRNVNSSASLPYIELLEQLKDESELNDWLKNKTISDRDSESIGITFKYINEVKKEFKYEIRSNSLKMLTNQKNIVNPTPYEIYQNYSSFLIVQIVIESELLKTTGYNFNATNIFLGEFPKKKLYQENGEYVLYTFIMIAYVFLVASVTREVLQEKATGIKELMKILGVSSWMIWVHWLFYHLMVQVPVTVLMTVTLVAIEPTVLEANAFAVWLLLFIFTLNCIFLLFSLSCLFSRPMRGMSICVIGWFVLNMSTMGFIKNPSDYYLHNQIFMCLIPLHNLFWAITTIHSFSDHGLKWTLSDLFRQGFTGSKISVGISIIIFLLETIFWLLLYIALDYAKPGPYGISKPYAFFKNWLKKLKGKKPDVKYNTYEFKTNLPKRFELPPPGAKAGIKIRGVRKEFGWINKVVAVESVDLDIYEGEIMVLLGHNGAGKTTMMSMITGLFSPSQGSILVDNKDINVELAQFRQSLGLCTQHNMYFPKLTVIEHLLFFGMLKGMSFSEAKECGLEILDQLNIADKKNSTVYKLSGGMQRKLCLGMSLIGKPNILILDEPTSGLDPENRRQLWDIILKMRGSRTILITTHFMEEADALGDRIAIMDQGQVVCCGTTMFLKRIYGTGYTVHILKNPQAISDDIRSEIKRVIPIAQTKLISQYQIDFVIKEDFVDRFPNLFLILEKGKKTLGITSISVTCTTLEDVFLRVGEKFAEGDFVEGENRGHLESITSRFSSVVHEKITGFMLFLQIFQVLIWKRFIFFQRNYLTPLIILLCSSTLVFIVVFVSKLEKTTIEKQQPLLIGLDIYPNSICFLKNDKQSSEIAKTAVEVIEKQGGNIVMVPTLSMKTYIATDLDTKNVTNYIKSTLLALDFNTDKFTMLYQPKLKIHSPAIAVNLGSNILLQNYTNKTGSISLINHPYVLETDKNCRRTDPFRVVPTFCWLCFMSCALIISMIVYIPLLTEERSSGFKHQQIIAGASPLLYWMSNFIFDFCLSICTITLFILIILIFGHEVIASDSSLMGLILQVLVFYSLSGLFFVYLFTFSIDNPVTCMGGFIIFNLAFALFPAFVVYLNIVENYKAFLTVIIIFSFNPTFAASISMGHIGKAILDEQLCRICGKPYCSTNNNDLLAGMPSEENRAGLLIYKLFLALSWILYLIIIIIIELDSLRKLKLIFCYKEKQITRHSTFEEDVKNEDNEVEASKEAGDTSYPLRVQSLFKKYTCGPKAVKHVTFFVKRGECFGLLGVNGAGKTTTFKILTGDILPNSGDAYVTKYSVIRDKKRYLSCIGYCPQFDALLSSLTGEETLEVIAKIRGIPYEDIKGEVKFLLFMLGITEHAKKRTVTYSGGTKRKLSTAVAFIGNPEVVFLDEPTTGVDPVSRRQLWGVVQARQWAGQAVVLTSHNMEECEALCSRLTIMRAGQMQCVGTLEHLKKKYGKGYTVLIKLINPSDSELTRLKVEFLRVFPESLVKDEHITVIHYQILNPFIPLSRLFTEMLRMKDDFSIVEDFNVSNTTLEQLFLTFARKEETPVRRKTLFSF